jgi:hypothetical protein
MFIDKNKKRPAQTSNDANEKYLGKWISHQLENYNEKKKSMKNDDIYNEWKQFIENYYEYFKTNEEIWFITLDKIKTYINKYNKRPSSTSDDNEVKTLGIWLIAQATHSKTEEKIMKNETIHMEWIKFTEEYSQYFMTYEEIWYNTLNQLKVYIDTYNKRPASKSINIEEKKLGIWISNQQNKYNRNELKDEISNTWKEFVTKYQIYFRLID